MTDLLRPKTLSSIPIAVTAVLKGAGVLPTGATIETAPGILTERFLTANPVSNAGAAFAGLGRVTEVARHANGVHKITLKLGVFLIPPPGKRKGQTDHLADIVGHLALLIDGNRFGLAGASQPTGLTAVNHYSASLDKRGTSLWAFEWAQTFHLFDENGAVTQRKAGGINA
jgi:hypothetical protein